MKIIVTKDQLTEILSNQSDVEEQEDPTDAQPTSGASDKQSGSDGYPEVTTWSNIVGSKLTRGVANPIGNEPRPDLVNREGPDNQITEQNIPIMKIGMRGSNIGQLQQLLIKNGYKNISNNGQPDNIFGSKTQASVIQFQKDRGLPVDGQVGPITWKALITPKTNTSQRNDMFVAPDIKAKQGDYLAGVNNLNQQKIWVTQHTYMKPNDKKTLYVEFTPNTLNKIFLEIREIMFSGWGIIGQTVLTYAGAEIGGPIIVMVIDGLIFVNDIYLFGERGINIVPPDDVVGSWNRFKWLIKNNEDFLRLMEDAIILLTAGIGSALKGAAKGVEDVIEFFSKYSKNFEKACKLIADKFAGIRNFLRGITKLPKMIMDWLRDKIAFIDKIVQYFEKLGQSSNTYVRAVSKLPTASALGLIGDLSLEFGQATLSWLLGLTKKQIENPTQEQNNILMKLKQNSTNQQTKENSIYNLKIIKLFPNLPRNQFKLTTETYNGNVVFIINNQRYSVDPSTDNLTKI